MGCVEVIWALAEVKLLEKDWLELLGGVAKFEGKLKEKVKASVVSEGTKEANLLIMNEGASETKE